MLSSKFLILSYIIILYTIEKKILRYCVQGFSTEEILKHYIKDRFKINVKQKIVMPKKDEYVKSKNYERKIKSPFIIYRNLEVF